MKFKNKQDYLEQLAALKNSIEGTINDLTDEECKAKLVEIETLENAWEEQAKHMANKAALENKFKALNLENKGVNPVGTVVIDSTNNVANDDMFASLDYRKAFMNNVLKGTAIPNQFLNIDANTVTGDVGSVIPTTVLEKIIEKLESTGMILPLVTRTSYKGGLSIPLSTVKPVATWVSQGSTSDKQKKTTGVITFNYFKLRCAVSVSLEVATTTLGVFEAAIINNITEAMTKALEQSIFNGDGTTQPKGILKETVVEGQNVNIVAAEKASYQVLVDAEAALPLAYESEAVWCMTKKTFMSFIGMVDSQKQPIARINYGIAGKPERTLLGRTVVLNEYMPNLTATVEADTVVAFLFNFKDYVLNTNYNITLKKYEDNDTDDQVTKAIMLVDGKVVDKNSLVTITKTLL